RRNRTANHSHGFLSRDGAGAAEIALEARRQLEAYQTISILTGNATAVSGERDRFVVECAEGAHHTGRRAILATGVRDHLPVADRRVSGAEGVLDHLVDIEGMVERWGAGVFHCPYCHGEELDRGRIDVIGSGAMSTHQAELVTEWGAVTFLPIDALTLGPET